MSCPVDFDEALPAPQHLAQCVDCRLEAQVREAFRGGAEVAVGDELLIARTVNGVLTRRSRLRRPERRAWAVAAALLLFGTGVASGSLLVHWHVLPAEEGASPAEGSPTQKGARTRRHAPWGAARSDETRATLALDEPAPIEATPNEPSAGAPEPNVVAPPPTPAPAASAGTNARAIAAQGGSVRSDATGASSKSTARASTRVVARLAFSAETPARPAPPSELTSPSGSSQAAQEPSALLAGGLAARSHGEIAQAIVFFETLERRFPETPEAMLSFVSLGTLFLDRDEPDRALTAFEHYLAAAPSGTLVEEALAGKARALTVLGRTDEAHAILRALAARFPSSPHARASSPSP